MLPWDTLERLLGVDVTLLTDVHTIKELADILPLDHAHLVDERSAATHVFDRVALQSDLILDASLVHFHAFLHRHPSDDLLSEEVTDLQRLPAISWVHVDGEMCIHKLHCVLVAPLHAREHVVDVAANGLHGSELTDPNHFWTRMRFGPFSSS